MTSSTNEPAVPGDSQGAGRPPIELPTWGPPSAPALSTPDRRRGRLVAIAMVVTLAVVGSVSGLILGLSSSVDDEPLTIDGDGYSYEVPDDWHDASALSTDDPTMALVDSMSGPVDADGDLYSGILVEIQDVGQGQTARQLATTWRRNVGRGLGATPEPVEPTTIAGEPAPGVRAEYDREGTDMVLRGFLVVREGTIYSIGFRAEAATERESLETFDAVLDSWTWDALGTVEV